MVSGHSGAGMQTYPKHGRDRHGIGLATGLREGGGVFSVEELDDGVLHLCLEDVPGERDHD